MPNFDPAQPLPAEYQSQPQTQGLIPGQGFAIAGLPSDPNAASHAAAVNSNPLSMGQPLSGQQPHPDQAAQNASVLATLNAPINVGAPPVAAPPGPAAAPPAASPPPRQAAKLQAKPGGDLGPLMDAAHPDTPIGSEPDEVDTAIAEGAATPDVAMPPPNLTPAQAEVWKAGQEAMRLSKEKVALAEQQATLDKEAAAEKAKVATSQEVEANQLYQDQQTAAKEASDLRKSEYKKYQNFAFHDLWHDRGAAREALAGFGILLGSPSYDSQHVNQASQLIDKAVTRDFQSQELELQRKEKLASMSAHTEQELADLHAKMRASLRFKQEAQLNAIATKLESMSSLGKSQGNVLAAKELANTARHHAAQFGAAGEKAVEESVSRRLDDERTKAQTRHLNAETGLVRVKSATEKGTGGDGLMAGMSAAERRQARSQYHQDVTKSAQIIEKEVRKPYEEARKTLEFIDKNPNNPEAWIGARDFFVRAVSGGKVTQAQYKQAAQHGAPGFDKLNQLFESATTGLPSATQRQNLRAATEALVKVQEQVMQAKRDEFEQNFGQDEMATKDPLGKRTYSLHQKRLFADVPKSEAKPVAQSPSSATVDQEAIAWARANSKDPRAALILKKNGL